MKPVIHWRYIQEDAVSADNGLATDEFLMESHSEENLEIPGSLRLYTYRDHCALVGRFQNIHAELDLETCKLEGVQFSRRLTGGGAIIMGQDQLGICLATSPKAFEWQNLRELYVLFSKPIIQALQNLGIEAVFCSKNDLEVEGRKIAGLGIHVNPKGAIQFHTSLLVDLDIIRMLRVLQIPIQKYSDRRKIQSVEQRITTVSKELNRKVAVEEVRQEVKKSFEKYFRIHLEERPVSAQENDQIEKIAQERYLDDEWIYQRSPQPDMTGMGLKKTPAGLLRTYIGLKGETIKSVLITGDFFEGLAVFKTIERQLKWSPLDKEKIGRLVKAAFAENEKSAFNICAQDIVEAIWIAARRARAENRFTYNGSCYYPKV